jgi:CheY-like chemotaxis protein
MERTRVKILIVDDQKANGDILKRFFELNGIAATSVCTSQDGIALARQERFHLAFLDINLPVMNGFAVLEALKTVNPDCKFAIISGSFIDDLRDASCDRSIIGFLQKPFDFNAVLQCVDMVCAEK